MVPAHGINVPRCEGRQAFTSKRSHPSWRLARSASIWPGRRRPKVNNIFQIHGINSQGEPVVRKALRRSQMLPFFAKIQPCLVGIEACGTSHHWARELIKLGHDVRLMPPAYVKPYVKRGKTDAADAEAICEAVTRPTM